MTDNVVPMPAPLDKLAQQIRTAFDRTERGRQEWIEGTLELAAKLAEARARFGGDDVRFGVWLVENRLNRLGDDDRAALINMAGDLERMRHVLTTQQEQLRPDTIWRKVKGLFRTIPKEEPPTTSPPVTRQTPPKTDEIDDTPKESAPKTPEDESGLPHDISPLSVFKKLSSKKGWPGVEAIDPLFTRSATRWVIGKALKKSGIGRHVWDLLLIAAKAGFITPSAMHADNPTMRILFPLSPAKFCNRFDLTNKTDLARVQHEIMPAALANREAIIANPSKLEDIVSAYLKEQREAAAKAKAEERIAELLKAAPPEQRREIIMYGVRLWPRVDNRFGEYDHDQLCTAIWFFQDADRLLTGGRNTDPSPGSRAISIRHLVKWFERHATGDELRRVRKTCQLVGEIATLFEANSKGECRPPAHPTQE